MLLSLTVIALFSAMALGFTYTQTKDVIAEVKRQKDLNAIKEVLPEFENEPDLEMYTVENFIGLKLYPAKKGGQLAGTAVKTFSGSGFSGDIWIMVGFDSEGKIINTSVVEHKETPGLGSKMEKNKFKSQFVGINPGGFNLEVKKDGGNIDAITAATISSRAFCEAVKMAYDAFKQGSAP
jgi:electron transport complex protein RnfG